MRSGWLSPLKSAAALVPGAALGLAAGATALIRRRKPLHPTGGVGHGILTVFDPLPQLGIAVLAGESKHPVTARWSKAMSTGDGHKDVDGMAIEIAGPGGPQHVLFASTGTGPATRWTLQLRAPDELGPLTTLLPLQANEIPVWLRLDPVPGSARPELPKAAPKWRLLVGVGQHDWVHTADLAVHWGPDEPIRFDPIKEPLEGAPAYPWIRTLREPAYWLARKTAAKAGRLSE